MEQLPTGQLQTRGRFHIRSSHSSNQYHGSCNNCSGRICSRNINNMGWEESVPERNQQPAKTIIQEPQVKNSFCAKLLYEQNLGFIPNSLSSRQDPRYVFSKFKKDYNNFDFTNEDILHKLELLDLLKYLTLLQISKLKSQQTLCSKGKILRIILCCSIQKSKANCCHSLEKQKIS